MLSLDAVLPAAFLVYESGVDPPGSLVHLSGLPSLGTTLSLGLDNPLESQGSEALSFLFLSLGRDPCFSRWNTAAWFRHGRSEFTG
ncbi:MAG: hypothetical protein ACI8QS_002927 [Planctomycetota bacterium]|jgi:hypothetical protein